MKDINVRNLIEISVALSTEGDFNKLFARILNEAMEITGCDGGTLYINKRDFLYFKIMRTKSIDIYKGQNGEEIDLPPVAMSRENVCAYAAMEKRVINIEDVYISDTYDFSGPKNYDSMMGFKTTSMLVVPMENHYGEVLGVLQLINALDRNNQIIPFNKDFEDIIKALASLAAVCMTNMNHFEEIKGLFDSFVSAISSAIDERTPYNASHTKNMVRYGKAFLDFMNEKYMNEKGTKFFTTNQEEQFIMSVWLHDMGKLAIPTDIMNKETRLGEKYGNVECRFKQMKLLNRIQVLEGKIEQGEYDKRDEEINAGLALVKATDGQWFLPEEIIENVRKMAGKTYISEEGTEENWLTDQELALLTIKKGTLSDEERNVMENHVTLTKSLLERINFTNDYRNVPVWAANHHEFLDGSGYPNHRKAEDLTLEMRLLTILDIFDALTATDRPYKDPMPIAQALLVLDDMVKEGKLDGELVDFFKLAKGWVVNDKLKY